MPLLSVSSKLNRSFALTVLLTLLFIFGAFAEAGAQGNERKEFQLFGTKEFRSSIKSLPKWTRVVNFEKGHSTFDNLREGKAARWEQVKEKALKEDRMGKLKRVNRFFNQWPYRTDMEAWGQSDYWATPKQFISKSGDCEDFAIVKYYALKSLGVPIEDMRIAILNDSIRGLEHAVLAVDVDGTSYILDNVSNLILADTKLKHYKPYFSVNENFRWVHLPPDTVNPSKSVIK